MKRDSEEGMVMIEATYTLVIAIMVIFFTINVGVLYHNRIVITSIANESAANIAGIYGRRSCDPFYSYIDAKAIESWNPYRYMAMGEGAYSIKNYAVKKTKWYASYLLSTQEFTKEKEDDFSEIEVSSIKNGLGQDTIYVVIDKEYEVFILNPAAFFGFSPTYRARAEGIAVCYDMIRQMNDVAFWKEKISSWEGAAPLLKEIMGLIQKINTFVMTATK